VGDQLYVYDPVPPLPVAVAVPVEPPLQSTGVIVAEAVSAVGCVTVTVATAVQPLASVIVQEYVCAERPVAFAVPCPPPGAGDQLYVYDPVPPLPVAVAVPVEPPLQSTGVIVAEAVSAVGWVMRVVAVAVHPLASVTVTV
jgi:hypothetical protein